MDRHAERVYEWEGEWADWNRPLLTLPQVRGYVRTACAYYGLRAPPVRKHPGRAYAYTTLTVCSFPTWCMNAAIALHEAAHFIVMNRYPKAADHGPTWLGVYLWLMEKAAVAPPEALRATLHRRRLRWMLRPGKEPARRRGAVLSRRSQRR